MANLIPTVRTALGRYWSEIFGGAALRLNTADLFNNIRSRAAQLGLPSVGVSASAISTLRGYAGRMLSAAGRLNRAPDSAIITERHLAEAPWARPLTEQNTLPIWHAIFDHTIQKDDGSVSTIKQTIVFTGTLPDTIGDLRSQVAQEAALMAAEATGESEGTPHGMSLGVDNIMLLAV